MDVLSHGKLSPVCVLYIWMFQATVNYHTEVQNILTSHSKSVKNSVKKIHNLIENTKEHLNIWKWVLKIRLTGPLPRTSSLPWTPSLPRTSSLPWTPSLPRTSSLTWTPSLPRTSSLPWTPNLPRTLVYREPHPSVIHLTANNGIPSKIHIRENVKQTLNCFCFKDTCLERARIKT